MVLQEMSFVKSDFGDDFIDKHNEHEEFYAYAVTHFHLFRDEIHRGGWGFKEIAERWVKETYGPEEIEDYDKLVQAYDYWSFLLWDDYYPAKPMVE